MRRPKVTLIAGMSSNRVIGIDNKLPWHQPKDLKHFKACTQGKPIIMGRKTFESIGRPLPNRLNIVMSRDASYEPDGVTMVSTMEEAIAVAGDAEEVMVIGGATIYEQTCRDADALELTVVHKEIEGDAFFPDFVSLGEWILKRMTFCEPDEDNPLPMTFMRLEKLCSNAY